MLSNRTLKLLCLGFLIVTSSASAAEEKKEEKKEEKDKKDDGKSLTLDVEATECEHVKVDSSNANEVVFKTEEGYTFKTLKFGDKTLYTVDTGKFKPVEARRLVRGEKLFFLLKLSEAEPVMFRKVDKAYSKFGYDQYLEKVVFKDKEHKDLDLTNHNDESLFTAEDFGTGKSYTFKNTFRVKDVLFDKKKVHSEANAKFVTVRVYQSPDAKRVFRLNYFFKGDGRFKEVYYKFDGDKAVRMELSEVNKFLNEFNKDWPTDYKPLVDRFSPLVVLSSLVIVTFAVFFTL